MKLSKFLIAALILNGVALAISLTSLIVLLVEL